MQTKFLCSILKVASKIMTNMSFAQAKTYTEEEYTPSYGFEELDIYTDRKSLFERLRNKWFNLNVFLLAKEMQLDDVFHDDIFNHLPKEKQSELIGRKDDFAKKARIIP